jgi:polyvinyl alcohol dehydrogenase (cytochrome)
MKWLTALVFCLSAPMAWAAPDGAKLFADHCSACHDHPTGRIPPRYVLNRLWPDQVVTALTAGPMRQQAAGLSKDDIGALVFYITRKQAGGAEPDPKANLCTKPAAPIDLKAPGWNGWGPNLENTRYQPAPGLAAGDVPKLKLKWAFAYPGGETVGQPVIVGDRLFVSAVNGRIFALDAKTGCTWWSFKAEAPVKGAITVGPLGAGDPARLAAFFADMTANVYAVDAMTGEPIWKVLGDPHPVAQIRGSPKLLDGKLYVPISSGEENASADPAYPCCTFRGGVAVLDAATGKTVWRSHTIADEPKSIGKNQAGTEIFGPAGASVWNSPTIDLKRRRIYVGTGNSYSQLADPATDSVMAFDLDTGKRLWFTQGTQHDIWVVCRTPGIGNCPAEIGPDFDFGSSIALETASNGRQVLLAGQKSGAVYGIDPDDGKILWKVKAGLGGAFGGVEHGIAVKSDTVYVPVSDFTPTIAVPADQLVPHKAGGLLALDILTGKQLWRTPSPEPGCAWGTENCSAAQAASPAVIPGIVFSGSLDGHIRAYATGTGAIVWDFDTAAHGFNGVNGAKVTGGAISGYGQTVAGGMVYVNAGGGYFGPPGNALLAFSVDGK